MRMTAPSTVKRLGEFVRYVIECAQAKQQTNLVLAGDVVDFLAEEPFCAFSTNEEATRKLNRILESTAGFWDALRLAVQRGVRVSLLVGNHDVELSLAESRQLLKQRIGAELELILDGEALAIGPTLIEHGNRYDAWNVVPHGEVRAFRSATSRREEPPCFPEVPGSRLVVNVINDLKRDYPVIDLLKPEIAVIPIIAFLDPSKLSAIRRCMGAFAGSRLNHYSDAGQPIAVRNIGTPSPSEDVDDASDFEVALRYAEDIARAASAERPTAVCLVGAESAPEGHASSDWALLLLSKALRYLLRNDRSFAIDSEQPKYLRPADAAHHRGFQVVAYGHTHLAKKQKRTNGWYLNSGTWADLVRIPRDVLAPDHELAFRALRRFLEDIQRDRCHALRELRATFVEVAWDASREEAVPGLNQFFEDGSTRPLEP